MTIPLTSRLIADQPEYLSPDEAAAMIPGMTKGALAGLRFTGKGPKYRKPTARTVIYEKSEVIEWIEASARRGTAQDAVA
ncbi:hypothetical protein B7R54_15155 [Subtercola boreus]|uniref:DNA-binding protein n=1 Tax=Subtercola boreus TaxID=120213 RepID=A0A3E0VKA3_9MICO|nr:hypothetical protein [Subtercola boreus]RFA10394.1 hypothetical protein B7R54_15155 [Subtercola boreus]TQL56088.1 hypothetical protein FB464_3669 [Subtercola boreus]